MERWLTPRAQSANLLILGLFFLWNLQFASLVSSNHPYVARSAVITVWAWKSLFFVALTLSLAWASRKLETALIGVAIFIVFWMLGARLVHALLLDRPLKAMLPLVLFLALVLVARFAISAHLKVTSRIVFVFATLVLAQQGPGVWAALTTHPYPHTLERLERDVGLSAADVELPHIIYIVPDRYASNANLSTLYGFSNHNFSSELKDLGFHVWQDQNANYPKTFLSLASTLNSEYLDQAILNAGTDLPSHTYIEPLIQNSAARRSLQRLGYTYSQIGKDWGPTERNEWADDNFEDETFPANSVARSYFEITPLLAFLAHVKAKKTPCEMIHEKADYIRGKVTLDTPQFVLWHSFITHDPYVFDTNGSCRSRLIDRNFHGDYDMRKSEYLAHIDHFNRISLELISNLFRESSREVIIVIQSDEGPFPKGVIDAYGSGKYNYRNAPDAEKQRKHGIFNAIYLPSQRYEAAAELRSPINNFRLILRELTGQAIPLLEDRFYSFEYEDRPYDVTDITSELQRPTLRPSTP